MNRPITEGARRALKIRVAAAVHLEHGIQRRLGQLHRTPRALAAQRLGTASDVR